MVALSSFLLGSKFIFSRFAEGSRKFASRRNLCNRLFALASHSESTIMARRSSNGSAALAGSSVCRRYSCSIARSFILLSLSMV